MYVCENKEGWAPKNWCFQTVVLEKTLESPLDSKEIKPVNPKGNQSRIFTGRIDTEPKAPVRFHLMQSWLTGKDPDTGKDWEGETEDEMVGNRGWDGWMASLTQWTWVWAKSGRQWRTGKPGVLHSMGLQNQTWLRDWATIIFLNELINTWELRMGLPRFSDKESPCQCRICGFHPWVKKISWRRKWQPTPVFLPGKSHVQRNSVGYTPWGQKELDTTKEQQKELRLNLLSLHPTDSSYLNRYLSILLKNQRERFLLACFLHSLPSFLHYTSIWLPTKCQTLILLGLQQHTQFQESLQSGGGVLVIYGSL